MRKYIDIVLNESEKLKGEIVYTSPNGFAITLDKQHAYDHLHLYRKGKSVGFFFIDLSHAKNGYASLHSDIVTGYQRLGLGTMVYDWAEKYVAKKGLTLRASDNLTAASAAFWQKRNPEAMTHSRVWQPSGEDTAK